jgi:hypothetical protein
VYVVDARFENIQVFDRSGQLLLGFGQEGTGPGEFWLPTGLHIDSNDRLWVCDMYNGRVQVFDYVRADVAPDAESDGGSQPAGEPERSVPPLPDAAAPGDGQSEGSVPS